MACIFPVQTHVSNGQRSKRYPANLKSNSICLTSACWGSQHKLNYCSLLGAAGKAAGPVPEGRVSWPPAQLGDAVHACSPRPDRAQLWVGSGQHRCWERTATWLWVTWESPYFCAIDKLRQEATIHFFTKVWESANQTVEYWKRCSCPYRHHVMLAHTRPAAASTKQSCRPVPHQEPSQQRPLQLPTPAACTASFSPEKADKKKKVTLVRWPQGDSCHDEKTVCHRGKEK